MNFLKRNAPIFIIGTIILGAFLIIIVMSQQHPTQSPILEEVTEEDLIYAHTYVRGNPDAPVTLVEFIDYKNPDCAEYYTAVELLYENYKQYLRIALRHLPDSKESRLAATAAQISGEYNKFWEYSSILLANQKDKFKIDELLGYAQKLNIPTGELKETIEGETFDTIINADIKSAQKLGITNTPTFFLNGERMEIESVSHFKRQVSAKIEEYLPKETPEVSQPNDVVTESTPTITGTNVRKLTPEEQTASQAILEIQYTDTGWSPNGTKGYRGQTVRWTNTTDKEITLKQLDPKFPELSGGVKIAPQKTFEFVLYKDNLWRYKEEKTQHYGFINIITPKL